MPYHMISTAEANHQRQFTYLQSFFIITIIIIIFNSKDFVNMKFRAMIIPENKTIIFQ